jgi:hypothetical protein
MMQKRRSPPIRFRIDFSMVYLGTDRRSLRLCNSQKVFVSAFSRRLQKERL